MSQLGRFAPGIAYGGRKYNSTPTPTPYLNLLMVRIIFGMNQA